MKIGCALLAAGAGKRFGGEKLLHEVGGEPMIARAMQLYQSHPFAARACVTRAEATRIQSLARGNGFLVVINPDPERGVGTSVSIVTAELIRQEPELDGILYAVSDQPFLTQQSVQKLIDAFAADSSKIASLAFEGNRGNPAIFPKDLFGELQELGEDIGGGAVIRRNKERLILVEAESARELEDIDTREGT